MGQHHKALVCAVAAMALTDVAPEYEELARRRLRKMGVVFLEDDDAVAIIRSGDVVEEHRMAASAAIALLVARGINGIPLHEDNARIHRLVAEFGVEPPQI